MSGFKIQNINGIIDVENVLVPREIFSSGNLYSVGGNTNGELGIGTSGGSNTEQYPVLIGSSSTWKQVSGCRYHTMAIKIDGTMWAWGYGGNGRMGTGSTTDRSVPTQIGTSKNWKYVSAGPFYGAAIQSDGSLWAWGGNGLGSIGDGTITERLAPVKIGNDTNWAHVACGASSTSALKTDGTLWAWGDNQYGQLGDGTIVNKSSPIQIGSDTDWVSVQRGIYHTLALKSNGTLWAWGNGAYGVLGLSSTTSYSSPVQVGSNTTWSKIFNTGYVYTSIAIKTDGTLWCWGAGSEGRNGDGTTVNRSSPVQTSLGGTNWKFASSAGNNTYAIKTDGTLWGWGENLALGQGAAASSHTFTPIQIFASGNWKIVSGGERFGIFVKSAS